MGKRKNKRKKRKEKRKAAIAAASGEHVLPGETVEDVAASPAPAAAPSVDASPEAASSGDAQVETGLALRHLGQATAVIAALVALTYVVPLLHPMRPWVPGERLPMSRLFNGWTAVPSYAGAGSGYQTGTGGSDVASELGEEVAASLRETQAPQTPPPARTEDGAADVRIDPSEYQGIRVEIVDPSGRGMRPFYEQLARTARGEEAAITRMTHYGDSTIATDRVTYTMRRRLQQRFGDGGHGFVLTSKGFMPYRHRDLTHHFNGQWTIKEITRAGLRDGRYGVGGVMVQARGGGLAVFGSVGVEEDEMPPTSEFPVGRSVSRFRVFYQQHPRGGNMRLTLDDEAPREISTMGDTVEDAVEVIETEDGPHRLEMRFIGGGRLLTYGVSLEREGPGVVYDSMGLVGARAQRMLNYDPAHIEGQLRMLGTHLLILGFGGNDASDNHSEDGYYEQFREIIARMRSGREDLGCLVFAPLDQAARDDRGHIRTMRPLPRIVRAQERAAAEMGCAFYNTFEAMGGAGSMQRWYRSRPRLAFSDFRHATPEGYEVIASLFYKALLKGFAEYLESTPAAP